MKNQTPNGSVWQYRWHIGVVAMLLCTLLIAAPRAALSFQILVPFVKGASYHENITREGLGFLRRDAYETAVSGNWSLDFSTLFADNPDMHFDDSSFRETTRDHINNTIAVMQFKYNAWHDVWGGFPQDDIQRAFFGLYAEDGGGNLDALGYSTMDKSSLMFQFGRILHSAQDLYSHSNWVELRAQSFLSKRLFDTLLDTEWREPVYWQVYPEDSGIVIAEGNSGGLPGFWTVSFLSGSRNSTYAGRTMKIVTPFGTKYGLLTGRYHDGFEDRTHETVYWTHNDDFGQYTGLNKDFNGRVYYDQAAELAVLQTAHEWERFLSLVRRDISAEAADTLERYSVSYKDNIYVEPSFRNADNFHGRSNPLTPRSAFTVPNGTFQNPYRYVSVAKQAALPAGATMRLDDDTHVGVQTIGRAGRPLRIVRWHQSEGPGIARIEN